MTRKNRRIKYVFGKNFLLLDDGGALLLYSDKEVRSQDVVVLTLLKDLLDGAGRRVPREQLYGSAHGPSTDGALTKAASRLRALIGEEFLGSSKGYYWFIGPVEVAEAPVPAPPAPAGLEAVPPKKEATSLELPADRPAIEVPVPVRDLRRHMLQCGTAVALAGLPASVADRYMEFRDGCPPFQGYLISPFLPVFGLLAGLLFWVQRHSLRWGGGGPVAVSGVAALGVAGASSWFEEWTLLDIPVVWATLNLAGRYPTVRRSVDATMAIYLSLRVMLQFFRPEFPHMNVLICGFMLGGGVVAGISLGDAVEPLPAAARRLAPFGVAAFATLVVVTFIITGVFNANGLARSNSDNVVLLLNIVGSASLFVLWYLCVTPIAELVHRGRQGGETLPR